MNERPRSSLGTRKISKTRERREEFSLSPSMSRGGRGRGSGRGSGSGKKRSGRRSYVLPEDEIEHLFGERRATISSPSALERAHTMRKRRIERFEFCPEDVCSFPLNPYVCARNHVC
jgi:hypothetical protein